MTYCSGSLPSYEPPILFLDFSYEQGMQDVKSKLVENSCPDVLVSTEICLNIIIYFHVRLCTFEGQHPNSSRNVKCFACKVVQGLCEVDWK